MSDHPLNEHNQRTCLLCLQNEVDSLRGWRAGAGAWKDRYDTLRALLAEARAELLTAARFCNPDPALIARIDAALDDEP